MKIYIQIEVPDQWATSLNMQQTLEREVQADRWAWFSEERLRKVLCGPQPDDAWQQYAKEDETAQFNAQPQRKPLPLKEVQRVIYEHAKINPNLRDDQELMGYIVNAVRAIEQAHGITGEDT